MYDYFFIKCVFRWYERHVCKVYTCLTIFFQYKSMGAIDHQGRVHLDPRGLIGSTCSGPPPHCESYIDPQGEGTLIFSYIL